ncbi:MAG: VWA domain-containing protein, partial [Thermoanaerobaculia bacterium]
MNLRRVSIIVALLAGTLPLGAQKAGTGAQAEGFGEEIDVRVVNVEAVVTDGKGGRVRGLSAADFRLLVDGREVPVEYFTEVAEGKAPAEAGGPAAPGETVPRSYLVYIDEPFSLASVRNEVLEKIERDLSLLRPEDRMAVLAFDGARIDVLSPWTGDRAALAAALRQARQRPAQGNHQRAHERKLQADVDWVEVSRHSLEDDDSKVSIVAAILRALSGRISPEARTQTGKTAEAAAASLRGFETPPGRKLLLMLSGAWSLRVAPRLYAPL